MWSVPLTDAVQTDTSNFFFWKFSMKILGLNPTEDKIFWRLLVWWSVLDRWVQSPVVRRTCTEDIQRKGEYYYLGIKHTKTSWNPILNHCNTLYSLSIIKKVICSISSQYACQIYISRRIILLAINFLNLY